MDYQKLLHRIKAKADQHDDESCCGCWIWNGGMRADGRYGKVRIGSRTANAHRASYMAANECIDLPLDISHVCHRNLCVNPNHLSHEDYSINRRLQHQHGQKSMSEDGSVHFSSVIRWHHHLQGLHF